MRNNQKQGYFGFSLGLKVLIIVFGILGQVLNFLRNHHSLLNQLKYYTNWSNLWMIGLSLYLLFWQIQQRRCRVLLILSPRVQSIRFAFTVGIALTFVVFSLLLLPKMNPTYLASMDNLLVHNLVPLLAIIDFVLFPYLGNYKPRPLHEALFMPGIYLFFTLVMSFSGVRYHGESVAPYFFLDYQKNGWFEAGKGKMGVIWWVLLIVALILLLAKLFRSLQELTVRREQIRVS